MTTNKNQNRGFLQVEGERITLNRQPILLKGAALGGWMNMENFITGYPGHEHQVRKELKRVLGQEKYEYFFDKFLEYFFEEEDAKFFHSLGLNCIRLPVNYRHFEDDANPRVFKKEGLKHLDRVVNLCAKYGIYTVIDLHSAPGGQGVDWHCDSGNHQANFWVHKDFQDRAVWLWEILAEHYKGNTWVAGYNPLNEPTDEEHVRLIAFYERIEKAIRAVDPHHILFLDGNTFGADFSHFKKPLPNSVYACHDYSSYGFPMSPEPFTGSEEQKANHRKQFARKSEYMRSVGTPVWNGEFGPVYAPTSDPNHETINARRYAVLQDQLSMYADNRTSWSIWLYKDIGLQGMVYVKEETAYMQLLKPFLEKKKLLAADSWGADRSTVADVFTPLDEWLEKNVPGIKTNRYPKMWKTQHWSSRLVRAILLSEELCREYAEYFRGKSREELDDLAKSFSFAHCAQRTKLNEVLQADSSRE